MKIVIESAGHVASRVQLGGHQIVFDQPSAVPGGEDRGPSPLDALAAAVGGCAHYFAAAFLHGRKLSTADVKVEIEYEKTRDPVPRLGRILLRVELPPGLPPHYMSGIERAVRNCPVYGTLVHSPEVNLEFVSASPAPEAEPRACC